MTVVEEGFMGKGEFDSHTLDWTVSEKRVKIRE